MRPRDGRSEKYPRSLSHKPLPIPSPGTLTNNQQRRSNVRQRATVAQNENLAADTLLTLFPSTFARILAHDVERNINGLLEYADNGCQEKQDDAYPAPIFH